MDSKGNKRQSWSIPVGDSKAHSNQESTASSVPTSGGDTPHHNGEPPPGSRSKHRIKLWDSFLRKTRKIRVRTKSSSSGSSTKLEKRSSSQPNISSDSSVASNSGNLVKDVATLSNGSDVILGSSHIQTAEYRRNQYIHQRIVSRSSSSLNNSPDNRESRPAGKVNSRVSFRYSEVVQDTGYYHSSFRRPSRTNLDARRDSEAKLLTDRRSSIETNVDVKDSEFDTETEERDNDPVTEDSSHQEPHLISSVDQHMSQLSLFLLNVHLREGKDLVIRDSCGTSDPYVKFKIGNKVLYKSRIIYKNLNPCWDENFTIPVDDISKPIIIKVFDYDRAWNDDPMGGAELDLSSFEINKDTEVKLMLSEKGKEEYMGYLLLTCTLVPKSEDDNKDQFFRRSTRSTDSSRKMKMQLWNGVVNIVLVEGSNLVSMDDNGFSDPYVKFKLGMEKYRSKIKNKTLNPRWLEQFDLHLYDDQTWQLEIMVFDHDTRGRDDFMGRAVIDLSQLEKEKTHIIEQQLEDGAGAIRLLLTVSGTVGHEIPSDLANYTPDAQIRDKIISRYGLLNSLRTIDDVGYLEVKVFRAHDLQAADFGGLSDPFCVLELVNNRVQTQTEYKTLNPDWSKVFTFQVKDIHSVLEVTVYDEDRNKKVEFLGKVAIPLLKIKNNERRWYALKDMKMLHKTKGAILLEMFLVFNHIKAGIRTVNPREEKLMLPDQKFKISIMKQNINRVSHLIGVFMETGRFIQSCFDWQSPPRSITAFIVYLVIVWNFELYMLPLSLLLIFMRNLLVAHVLGNAKKEPVEDVYEIDEEDEDDEEKEKQEEKKSIVDRYHAIQEVCLTVQQALDTVASLGERVKNTFNWSVPWLSTMAVIALLAGSIVLFYIPLRILLLAWGINKFTKKLRKPDAISNNELLDFLSRIPSDNELLQYKELRPDIPSSTASTKKKRP